MKEMSHVQYYVKIKGLMIWRLKCHQNNSPVVCDVYVKYEEAEIVKTSSGGGGGGDGGPCGIQ